MLAALAQLAGCSGSTSTGADINPQQGGGQDPPLGELAETGDVVGEFELALPSVTPFILHATLPVPRGTFREGSGPAPFQILSPTGLVVPAQVETVTRWAKNGEGADVVEILARVDRPTGQRPGDRARYSVVLEPAPRAPCVPNASVQGLLATANAVTLRSKDVFGNVYRADLLVDTRANEAKVLKDGRVARQTVNHEVLRPLAPESGPTGTLAHLMGVHAYVTSYSSEDFISLDLRIHNGFSGADTSTSDDDPMGKLYFESLELSVPEGWVVSSSLEDPLLGESYGEAGKRVLPLVSALPGGKLHVLPQMAQFHRRLVISRVSALPRAESTLREEGLGFARMGRSPTGNPMFSWWNPTTGRWYSQRHVLPSFTGADVGQVREQLTNQFAGYETQLAAGTAGGFPVESPALGWAHPWGIQPGGMVSGSEIYIFDGVDVAASASNEGYRLTQLRHRMYSDRQPNVLFNVDGTHTQVEQWVHHTASGDVMPIWWFNGPMLWACDPFGYTCAPTFQVTAVEAQNKQPSYENELLGYQPIDFQHLVRYTRSAKTLIWLGNDALAKDDVTAQAEGFRIAFSPYPQDTYGNIIPTGLLFHQNHVAANPGVGVSFGRGESWGLDAALVAYSTNGSAWRASARPWFDAIVDLLERGQSDCSGIVQATPLWNVFGAQYRCRQSIEAAIMENALVGLRESVYVNSDAARTAKVNDVLRRSFYSMISPLVWSTQHHGPWAMIAVGPFDSAQAPFCTYVPEDGNYGIADHYQVWSSFAYAYELTHDVAFLDKAAQAMGSSNLAMTLATSPMDNWQNKAALLALCQQMARAQP